MKILILGSAPYAEIPAVDHAYCANASAYYYADQLKRTPKIDCVVGAHIICASTQSGAHDHHKASRSYLNKSPMSGLTVLDYSPWFLGWDLPASLLSVTHETGVIPQVISPSRRSEVLFDTAGLREPILSHSLVSEINSPSMALRGAKLLFQALKHKSRKGPETNPALRPSTGLWAAMIAMEKYGPNAEYIISGISLTTKANRAPHPHDLRPGKFPDFTHHLHADRKVMTKLQDNYSIHYVLPGDKT